MGWKVEGCWLERRREPSFRYWLITFPEYIFPSRQTPGLMIANARVFPYHYVYGYGPTFTLYCIFQASPPLISWPLLCFFLELRVIQASHSVWRMKEGESAYSSNQLALHDHHRCHSMIPGDPKSQVPSHSPAPIIKLRLPSHWRRMAFMEH